MKNKHAVHKMMRSMIQDSTLKKDMMKKMHEDCVMGEACIHPCTMNHK